MSLTAEASLAKLIARRHEFEPGGDLHALVSKYADIEELQFPVDSVDGISLHLKSPDRRPNILINTSIPSTRAKFTLAHEFGHVLIPWHEGMIFSNISRYSESANSAYREMEAEANRFAAELLMPLSWLESLHAQYRSPGETAKIVRKTCGTSMDAVVIAVNNSLPAGYVYAAVDQTGRITASTSSRSTAMAPFRVGSRLAGSPQLTESERLSEYEFRDTTHCWLSYEAEQELASTDDDRTWREILDEIIAAADPTHSQPNLKMSLNGVISACNNPGRSAESFFAAVRQKLAGRDTLYQKILAHPSFNTFLVKRIEEFLARRK